MGITKDGPASAGNTRDPGLTNDTSVRGMVYMATTSIAPHKTWRTNCDCGEDHQSLIKERVRETGKCWEWTGRLGRESYGSIEHYGRWAAHRLSYVAFHGPIPDGLTIDHLCRNRSCVNPDHLEAVTSRTNTLRSDQTRAGINIRRTHCPSGHPYSGSNLRLSATGARLCRACIATRRQYPDGPLLEDDPRHGTLNGYNNLRCRCVVCREANAASLRAYRARRRESAKAVA